MMMYGDWSWWWLLPMIGCGLVFLAVVAGLLVAVLRAPWRAAPDDILHERFARGEVDVQEYEQRLNLLQQRSATAAR